MGDKLVILITTTFSKAQIITTRLEISGIECFLKNENSIQSNIGSEVKIMVVEDKLQKANAILQELHVEIEPKIPYSYEISAFSGLFIIPVDFSEASRNACFYALELACKFKSRIKLIHTYGLPELRPISFDDTDFYTGTLSIHLNDLRQDAELKMSELTNLLKVFCVNKSLGEIPIVTSIVNGLPDEITVYTSETEKAGLVIMGISRKDVRTFEPIGKIASRIVEKATCPVLIIPEDFRFSGIGKSKNILYTTAFDELDFAAIQKLISLVKRLDLNIKILHIGNEEGDPWDNIKMEGLKDYFAKAYNQMDVSYDLIYSNDILNAIDAFILENSVHIISMVTRKRNLLWKLINPSLTKKVLYHTQIPLLVFHA